MDKGLIIKRFGDRLNPQIINSVIKEFEFIREKVYLNGNPTEIVSQYLNYQLHIMDLRKQIEDINKEISQMGRRMIGIKNQPINQLRNENKLLNWLSNLTNKELSELKEIVGIKLEYKQIDEKRFRDSKMNSKDKVIIRM